MNGLRSPAPASAMFNIGGLNLNRRNNAVVSAANTVVNAANTAVNAVANAANTVGNTTTNLFKATNVALTNTLAPKGGPSMIQITLIILFIIIVVLTGVFWRQIEAGFRVLYDKIRAGFGAQPTPPPSGGLSPNVTDKPDAPQNDTVKEHNLVEKILPGRQEVFNVSRNAYTYYDAEPLCKAMGAELATYEQVKEAYGKGADWCNYGWVKGQMAVFPTQKGTWEQLQQGPEEERMACGQPGLNGGFFDNPELRFGVNCYGAKPDQKDHDATAIAAGEGAPLSPGALEFDKKVNKYRGEANNIAILPFNKSQWAN